MEIIENMSHQHPKKTVSRPSAEMFDHHEIKVLLHLVIDDLESHYGGRVTIYDRREYLDTVETMFRGLHPAVVHLLQNLGKKLLRLIPSPKSTASTGHQEKMMDKVIVERRLIKVVIALVGVRSDAGKLLTAALEGKSWEEIRSSIERARGGSPKGQ